MKTNTLKLMQVFNSQSCSGQTAWKQWVMRPWKALINQLLIMMGLNIWFGFERWWIEWWTYGLLNLQVDCQVDLYGRYTWGSLKIGERQVTMGFNTGLIGMLWKLPYTQWPCKRNPNWGYLPYIYIYIWGLCKGYVRIWYGTSILGSWNSHWYTHNRTQCIVDSFVGCTP